MQPLLSLHQVAELLNVYPHTVRAYIRDGKLKTVKLGRVERIQQSEVKRLIAAIGGDEPPDAPATQDSSGEQPTPAVDEIFEEIGAILQRQEAKIDDLRTKTQLLIDLVELVATSGPDPSAPKSQTHDQTETHAPLIQPSSRHLPVPPGSTDLTDEQWEVLKVHFGTTPKEWNVARKTINGILWALHSSHGYRGNFAGIPRCYPDRYACSKAFEQWKYGWPSKMDIVVRQVLGHDSLRGFLIEKVRQNKRTVVINELAKDGETETFKVLSDATPDTPLIDCCGPTSCQIVEGDE
jgi:excisionase family DNA binding protein